jgi:hypothetical protein
MPALLASPKPRTCAAVHRSAKFVYSNLKLIVLASANGKDGTATQGYDAVEYFSLAATADGVKGDPAFSCNNPNPNPKQFAHSE